MGEKERGHRPGLDDTRKSTSGMVQLETGYRSTINNGGGIHSGLQRSEGCDMGRTFPEGTTYKPRTANPKNRQRGGLQPLIDVQIPPPQPPHRTPISLPPPASPTRGAGHTHHPREEEPGRYPDQVHPDELDNSLETEMAGFDWINWIDLLMADIPTEDPWEPTLSEPVGPLESL